MMTHREAMLLLIDKTDRATEALKRLRDIDNHSPMAERRAVNLIRIAIDEDSRLTESDKQGLRELIHGSDPVQPEQRTETIRFRVTPNEKAALQFMADRYAGGNLSRLIMDALNDRYF